MTDAVYSVQDIATAIDAEAVGDTGIKIASVAEPQSAGPDDLAMATSPAYAEALPKGRARAAMLWQGADWQALGLSAAIIPKRPRFAMSGLTKMMDPGQGFAPGIHPSALVDPTAVLGEGVIIGAFTSVAAGAEIGARSVIGPHCSIGWNAKIGADALIRDSVSIGARVRIGARFICQPGARIGGDGFSFATPEKSSVEAARETLGDQQETTAQPWIRIHSLGAVSLGDDVEVGCNTTIDYGTIRDTEIGDRTKIDNLVHIGHNCVIGTDCLLCGQVGLAGSIKVGNHVVLGGQVGASDNIFIGDRVIAGGGSKIFTNVPAGRTLLGYPAVKMETHVESYKATRRLPRLMKDIAELKKAVFKPDSGD